jgi:hypothetical protein
VEANYAPSLLARLAPIPNHFGHDLCERNVMKILFISFVVGLGVGALYGLESRVQRRLSWRYSAC